MHTVRIQLGTRHRPFPAAKEELREFMSHRIDYTALYVLYLCAAITSTILYYTCGLLCFSEHRPCHLLQQLQQMQTPSLLLLKLMLFLEAFQYTLKNPVFNFQN